MVIRLIHNKMSAFSFIPCCVLLLLGLSSQVGGESRPPKCDKAAVENFSSSLYTALLLSLDPGTIFGLKASGEEASKLFYDQIYNEMTAGGLSNAGPVASSVAETVATVETFYLSRYLRTRGLMVGEFLLRQGIPLTCDNAVEYALKYFKLVMAALSDLDQTKLASYLLALRLSEFEKELGILEDFNESSAVELASIFREKFLKYY